MKLNAPSYIALIESPSHSEIHNYTHTHITHTSSGDRKASRTDLKKREKCSGLDLKAYINTYTQHTFYMQWSTGKVSKPHPPPMEVLFPGTFH